jgi:hypothetical protein
MVLHLQNKRWHLPQGMKNPVKRERRTDRITILVYMGGNEKLSAVIDDLFNRLKHVRLSLGSLLSVQSCRTGHL